MSRAPRWTNIIAGAAASALVVSVWASLQSWHTDEEGHLWFGAMPTLLTAGALLIFVIGLVLRARISVRALPLVLFVCSSIVALLAIVYHFTVLA